MGVGIDEAGDDDLPADILDTRVGTREAPPDVVVVSDADDPATEDRHRLSGRRRGVHRVKSAPRHDDVGGHIALREDWRDRQQQADDKPPEVRDTPHGNVHGSRRV